MFRNCSQLNTIEMDATDISARSACGNWVNGVSSTGTFIKNSDATWSNSGVVPSGWTVRQKNPMHNGHEYVDLGLKDDQGRTIYWATCNVGANSPEEYGDYFAWGEIEMRNETYTVLNYKFYDFSSGYRKVTKYCTNFRKGSVDNLKELDVLDDIGTISFGEKWQMPSKENMDLLLTNCVWIYEELNAVKGYRIVGNNGNSIFLPFAGYYENGNEGTISSGHYWTKSLDTDNYNDNANYGAFGLYLAIGYTICTSLDRYQGRSIRPVYIK